MQTGIILSVIVVAAFLLKGLIGWASRAVQARRQELLDFAVRRGWVCETHGASGFYTMRGTTEGVTWTLEAGREGVNSKSAISTRWSSDDVAYPESVLTIRTHRTFDFMQGRLGKFLLRIAQNPRNKAGVNPMMLIGDLLQNGKQLTLSSTTVAAKYVVLVKSDADLDDFVTADLERALEAWSSVPTRGTYGDTLGVDVGPNVRVYCAFLVQPQNLEAFVNLGVQVVAALKQLKPHGT